MNPSFSSPIRADLRLVLAAGRVTCTYNNTTAIKSITSCTKNNNNYLPQLSVSRRNSETNGRALIKLKRNLTFLCGTPLTN